jgi:2-dehydro-3-deoxyphosphogluconate aldolase/(4S)-4-hydroxy-2-oxoglutarate aldolase
MQADEVREAIIREKLIAIVRGVEGGKIMETVDALFRGGIHLVEITLDQSNEGKMREALDSIRRVKREFAGRVFPGAGTVLSPAQASWAIDAGAQYIVSPDMNPGVIRKTRKLGALAIPGALTPTEIVGAVTAGADFVKLFPAGVLGCEYVKAVTAPLTHVHLLAVGGVDLSNMKDFLQAGVVGFGIGGNLVDKKIISRGKFDEIEALSRAFVQAMESAAADTA